MGRGLTIAGRALPVALVGALLLGALRSTYVGFDLANAVRLCADTALFAAGAVLLAWPVVTLRPRWWTGAISALPPITVGAIAGVALRGFQLPSIAVWIVGMVVTALAIAPRLASHALVATSTRRELVDAALALGASPRQAQRLAGDAEGAGRRALLVALALAVSEGTAALAAWRIAAIAHPLPAGVALLQSSHAALLIVLLLALPGALSHRPVVATRGRSRVATSGLELTRVEAMR